MNLVEIVLQKTYLVSKYEIIIVLFWIHAFCAIFICYDEMVSVMSWFSNEAVVSEEAAATFLGQVRGKRGAVREQRDVPHESGEMLRTWDQGNIRHQCRKRYETQTLERGGLETLYREKVIFRDEGEREIVLLVEVGKRFRRMSLRNHRTRAFCQN